MDSTAPEPTTEAPSGTGVTVSTIDLREGLAAIAHAVARDPARPILTTISIQRQRDGLRLVAADNYRLAIVAIPSHSGGSLTERDFPAQANLPAADAKVLRACLAGLKGEARVRVDAGEITVSWGGGAARFRLMDGTFPDVDPVLRPAAPRPTIVLAARYLGEAGMAFARRPGEGLGNLAIEIAGPLDPVIIRGEPMTEIVMPIRVPGDAAPREDTPADELPPLAAGGSR